MTAPTKRARPWAFVAIGLAAGAILMFGFTKLTRPQLWSTSRGADGSAAAEEIVVLRTPGGLLEVSRINATEMFDSRFIHSVLLIPVGETVARIRVPAVYRYHVELAPEWRVLRTGDVFLVAAPPVKPTLPVAVDLKRMEKEVSGVWSLFTGTDDLDDVERSITQRLAKKAVSPGYITLQREEARKTVREFVLKWLVTQTRWTELKRGKIRVVFADETIQSLGADVLPVN